MAEEGPWEGMVSVREDVGNEMQQLERLDIVQIHELWKAAVASKGFMEDTVGPRLENSFWRILRSERVVSRMDGPRLAKQVKSITDGGYIRTTPTGSPRASRNLENYYLTAPSPAATSASGSTSEYSTRSVQPVTPSAREQSEDEGTPTPKPTSPFARVAVADAKSKQDRRSNLGRLPPILKKSGNGSAGSAKNSSLPSPSNTDTSTVIGSSGGSSRASPGKVDLHGTLPTSQTSSSLPRRYTATRFSEEVKVSIPKVPAPSSRSFNDKSPRLRNGSYSKSNKRNPIVKANAGSSKKRPIVMRQRSSVTSQEGSLGEASPTSSGPSTRTASYETSRSGSSSGLFMSTQSTRKLRSSSPHPMKRTSPSSQKEMKAGEEEEEKDDEEEEEEDDDASVDSKEANDDSDKDEEEDSDDTADSKNQGRSQNTTKHRTEHKQRPEPTGRLPSQHRSFTNLSSTAWRSTAVAPTAASYQASGLMAPGQGVPSKTSRKAFREDVVPLKAPGPSTADSNPSESSTILPRTRSQLALLLERNRTAPDDGSGKESKGRGKGKEPSRT